MLFSWVRRGLRTGVLTTRYPAVQEQVPGGFRGRPVLDADRCLANHGCKACTQACLPGALSLAGVVDRAVGVRDELVQLTLDYARCIMCGLCVSACPEDAMQVIEDYELAARNREDLRIVTVFAPSTPVDNENGKGEHDGRNA